MSKINIIVVDDHEIVRDGLRSLLLGNTRMKIIGEAPNAPILFQLLKLLEPDVIILDIRLPGMSGIDIAKVLQDEYPNIQVLILTANTLENYVISAVKAGAKGFLSKDSSKEELIEAIQTVYQGDLYFGQNITQEVLKILSLNKKENLSINDVQKLSIRELEVLEAFAEGLSYKEIAEQLNITPRTVESHKKNIFSKLHFQNNVDLVKYAIKNEIIFID